MAHRMPRSLASARKENIDKKMTIHGKEKLTKLIHFCNCSSQFERSEEHFVHNGKRNYANGTEEIEFRKAFFRRFGIVLQWSRRLLTKGLSEIEFYRVNHF